MTVSASPDLPLTLTPHASRYWWPPEAPLAAARDDRNGIAIVTAFFDIGRTGWNRRDSDVSPKYRRSVDAYFECFDRLAALRNDLVVFTESAFAPRILESRRAHGLDDRTTLLVIEDLFELPEVRAPLDAIRAALSDRYRDFLWRPSAPEFNKPEYVALVSLKSTFACTAVELGAVRARQLAWIDFGYVRDPASTAGIDAWAFDFGDKMNIFNIFALDDAPIYDIVRRADAYIQACHIVGPALAWADYHGRISEAFRALFACGLMDDEQTMMLMAFRAAPDAFVLRRCRPDSPLSWRFIFQRFQLGETPEDQALDPVRPKPQPDWFRTLKTVIRRRAQALLRRF
jgi:protein YibB